MTTSMEWPERIEAYAFGKIRSLYTVKQAADASGYTTNAIRRLKANGFFAADEWVDASNDYHYLITKKDGSKEKISTDKTLWIHSKDGAYNLVGLRIGLLSQYTDITQVDMIENGTVQRGKAMLTRSAVDKLCERREAKTRGRRERE